MTWKAYLLMIFSGVLIVIIIGAVLVMNAPQPVRFKNIGKAAPFTLQDQNNNTVTLNNYTGKVLIMDFIYTHCPNPNGTLGECSTETLKMNTLMGDLINMGYNSSDFHLISISFDWKFDNASTMLAYGKDRAEGKFQYWSFLSGNEQEVNNATAGYHISAVYNNVTNSLNQTVPEVTQPATNNLVEYMTHSLQVIIINKNGDIEVPLDSHGTMTLINNIYWKASDVANIVSTLINQ